MSPRDCEVLELPVIRAAMEGGTEDGAKFLQFLTDSAHRPVLERLQAYLGQTVGLTGTIDNPVVVKDKIKITVVNEILMGALMGTLQPQLIFRPPLSDSERSKMAYSEYLHRFTW